MAAPIVPGLLGNVASPEASLYEAREDALLAVRV
jgi:hypothetical protein